MSQYTPFPVWPAPAGDGEGVTVHNQLTGRTTAGAHPATAVSVDVDGITADNVGEAIAELLDRVPADSPVLLISPSVIETMGGTFTAGVEFELAALNGAVPAGRGVLVWDGYFSNGPGANGTYISDGVQTFTFDSVAPLNVDGLDRVYSSGDMLTVFGGAVRTAWRVVQVGGNEFGVGLIETQPTLNLAALFTANVDRSSAFFPFAPAGLWVGLSNQDDPTENGVYPTDGAGGVIVTQKRPLAASVTYLHRVNAAAIFGDADSFYGALAPYLDFPPDDTVAAGSYVVTTQDGVNFGLTPVGIPLTNYDDLVGRWFSPAMNDYSLNADTQLTLNHQVIDVDTQSNDVTLTLGPHATIVRPVFIHHRNGSNTLTVVNLPGDGDPFSYEVAPDEKVLILPNGAAWNVWRLPQEAGSLVFDNAVLADADSVQDALDMIGNAAMYALRSDGAGDYLLQNPGGVATSPTSIPTGAVKVFHGPDDPAATTIWGAYVEACDQWINPGVHHKIRNLADSAWVDM